MTRHVPFDTPSAPYQIPADGSAPAVDGKSAGETVSPRDGQEGKTAAEPGHFDTEHLLPDLKGRSIRGGAVTLGAQGVKFVLNLVSIVVLARLLTPADFGLVAMVTALTGFVAMFKDAGLSMATVQRDKVTHEQVSTLFWINVALSVVLMCVVAALAPVVAWFYGEPELVWVTLAIAATFILGGLTPQHKALLKRQMRFTAMAVKDITAMTSGITAGITLAWFGAGYWALVAVGATSSLVGVIMVWSLTGWIPGLPRRGTGVRPMLAFGGNITGFNLVNYFSRNADNVLIGWYWGAGPLGIYSRAYALMMLPITNLRQPLHSVALPVMSRLQNDAHRYRQYYKHMVGSLAFVTMPLAAFLFVASESLIRLVLGSQWITASAIFQALALTAFIQPSAGLRGLVLQSSGQAGRYLRLGVGIATVTVSTIIMGLRWGPLGVAVGYSLANYILLYPTLKYAFSATPIRVSDYFTAVAIPASASTVAAGVTMLTSCYVSVDSDVVYLAVGVVTFVSVYLATFALLPTGRLELSSYVTYLRHFKPQRAEAA